jgi:hypothetical protein
MLRRVPPSKLCGGAKDFSPWGSTLQTPEIPFPLLILLPSFSRLFVKLPAHRAGLPGNADIYYRAGFSPRLKGGASSRLARETRECTLAGKPSPSGRGLGAQYKRKSPSREARPFRAGSFTPLCCRRPGDCSNGEVLSS